MESLTRSRTRSKSGSSRSPARPHEKQRFPIGPASAKKLGYDSAEIDALPPP